MKKFLINTTLALSVLVFAGCSHKKPTPKVNLQQCSIDGSQAPSWVCDGGANMKGGIFAVGSAEQSPLGFSFQRTEAIAAARDALAREMSIKVENMFRQFQATTGIGDAQTAEKATKNVSKQVAKETLSGSKLVKTWKSPKGTLFVLVGISNTKDIQNVVKNAVKTSLHNDQALWQKFLADKADKELDAEVAKQFGGE